MEQYRNYRHKQYVQRCSIDNYEPQPNTLQKPIQANCKQYVQGCKKNNYVAEPNTLQKTIQANYKQYIQWNNKNSFKTKKLFIKTIQAKHRHRLNYSAIEWPKKPERTQRTQLTFSKESSTNPGLEKPTKQQHPTISHCKPIGAQPYHSM